MWAVKLVWKALLMADWWDVSWAGQMAVEMVSGWAAYLESCWVDCLVVLKATQLAESTVYCWDEQKAETTAMCKAEVTARY